MVVASVAVAATDVAVDVAAPIVVASLPLSLAAAEGHLHLNHALGNDVVNILPWVVGSPPQEGSCRVHYPSVPVSRREEEFHDVATAGGQLLLHLGVEVIVASICCVGLVLAAAGDDGPTITMFFPSQRGSHSLRMAYWPS